VKLEQSKTEWTLDLLTAELELDGRASELPEKEHFVYSVAGLPGVTVAMRPLPYGEGAVVIAVPAGKGEIVRFHDETGPVKAGALPVFELRPGQTAKCKRP
jgi:hypothetical protein